jgi:hypothetical protein
MFELQQQRVLTFGADAQRSGRKLSLHDRACIFESIENGAVFRRGFGVERAPPSVNEILCRDRRPIGPGMLTQGEPPGLAIGGHGGVLGGAEDRFAFRSLGIEAHHHVADDPLLPRGVGERGIEALDLGAIAAVKHVLTRCHWRCILHFVGRLPARGEENERSQGGNMANHSKSTLSLPMARAKRGVVHACEVETRACSSTLSQRV